MSAVELDLAAGEARLGALRVAIGLTPAGHIAVDDTVLRPLTFGERERVTRLAAVAADPLPAVAGAVRTTATVAAGRAEPLVAEILALHLAGARTGASGRSFDEAMLTLAQFASWTPEAIGNAEAAVIDRLADRAAAQGEDDGWNRVVFGATAAAGDGSPISLRDALARDLLTRLNGVGKSLPTAPPRAARYERTSEAAPDPPADTAAPTAPGIRVRADDRLQAPPAEGRVAAPVPVPPAGARPEPTSEPGASTMPSQPRVRVTARLGDGPAFGGAPPTRTADERDRSASARPGTRAPTAVVASPSGRGLGPEHTSRRAPAVADTPTGATGNTLPTMPTPRPIRTGSTTDPVALARPPLPTPIPATDGSRSAMASRPATDWIAAAQPAVAPRGAAPAPAPDTPAIADELALALDEEADLRGLDR